MILFQPFSMNASWSLSFHFFPFPFSYQSHYLETQFEPFSKFSVLLNLSSFRVGLDTHTPTHPLTPKTHYKQYTKQSTVGCLSSGFFPSNKFRWNIVRKLLHLIGPRLRRNSIRITKPSRDSSTTSRPQNYILLHKHNTIPRRNASFPQTPVFL